MRKSRTAYNAFVGLLLLAFLVQCQTSTEPTPDGSTYFPLQTGDYWIYQVTQDNYSLTNGATTLAFQLQQKISSSFTRNGQEYFQVEESTRKSDQAAWQIKAIRTVYKNLSEVVSQENNVPTLNLVFPISTTISWNINTYNALPDSMTLRYQDIGRPFTSGKQPFEQTISVVGPNDSTLVDAHKYQRVYAPNVGLIYRENAALAYCQSTPDCIGKGIIVSGTREKWTFVSSNRLP